MTRLIATYLVSKTESAVVHMQIIQGDGEVVLEALYRTDQQGQPTELIAQLP